ncbi:SemiSWEET transporter [Methylocapsa palsarum]|uniref:MtN3 and saliva related transmembrane protein n=1 Tax=Methylocapsa palsarum TaxID=1612308 RepID=A0A1I3YQ19_9HYPH|nr:SemiSWEET transporter [Methylocapsa palsarum]SFK33873.1 MtN3 and saliva related transmembrane protein [Methylocapsa palsarum]
MPAYLPDAVSTFAAILTTVCWLPQVIHLFRTRDTRAISLAMQIAFACGVALWLVFGFMIGNWPLIVANAVTLVLAGAIIALKIVHG